MHLCSKAPYFPFLYLVFSQKDLLHVFEISAGGGCPSWQAISFVKCSASLLSELCPWGSPHGVTRAKEEPSHHPSVCQGRGCFWKQESLQAPLLSVSVGRALSLGVFRHSFVCLAGDFPTKDSKTTTLVHFLEINYFEVHLNKKDKILPNP